MVVLYTYRMSFPRRIYDDLGEQQCGGGWSFFCLAFACRLFLVIDWGGGGGRGGRCHGGFGLSQLTDDWGLLRKRRKGEKKELFGFYPSSRGPPRNARSERSGEIRDERPFTSESIGK